MVERTYRIEDVVVKKGDIILNKDKNGNRNRKYKGKPWNKNKYIVNDGVVDAPKTKESTFNLSNCICATKQQETSKPKYFEKPKRSSKPIRTYTPMVESYEVVLKTFLANKLIMLPGNSCPYDPPVELDWWRDEQYCNYHRNKGHTMKNQFKLKDTIQDLIDQGKVVTDGLVKNSNHKDFKQPLPEYEKGETSKANKKGNDTKVSYAYTNTDNVINMIEPISESIYMMGPKFDEEHPIMILTMRILR